MAIEMSIKKALICNALPMFADIALISIDSGELFVMQRYEKNAHTFVLFISFINFAMW